MKQKNKPRVEIEPVLLQVRKVGGSLAVAIPPPLLQHLSLEAGSYVWIRLDPSREDALQIVRADIEPPK